MPTTISELIGCATVLDALGQPYDQLFARIEDCFGRTVRVAVGEGAYREFLLVPVEHLGRVIRPLQ